MNEWRVKVMVDVTVLASDRVRTVGLMSSVCVRDRLVVTVMVSSAVAVTLSEGDRRLNVTV